MKRRRAFLFQELRPEFFTGAGVWLGLSLFESERDRG